MTCMFHQFLVQSGTKPSNCKFVSAIFVAWQPFVDPKIAKLGYVLGRVQIGGKNFTHIFLIYFANQAILSNFRKNCQKFFQGSPLWILGL